MRGIQVAVLFALAVSCHAAVEIGPVEPSASSATSPEPIVSYVNSNATAIEGTVSICTPSGAAIPVDVDVRILPKNIPSDICKKVMADFGEYLLSGAKRKMESGKLTQDEAGKLAATVRACTEDIKHFDTSLEGKAEYPVMEFYAKSARIRRASSSLFAHIFNGYSIPIERKIRRAKAGRSGRFSVSDLPAGDYVMYAFQEDGVINIEWIAPLHIAGHVQPLIRLDNANASAEWSSVDLPQSPSDSTKSTSATKPANSNS